MSTPKDSTDLGDEILARAIEHSRRPAPDLPLPAERRRIREAARLSRTGVARAVGVTLTTVTRWELGERPHGSAGEAYAALLRRLAELEAQGKLEEL